jgi:hypothetical protein
VQFLTQWMGKLHKFCSHVKMGLLAWGFRQTIESKEGYNHIVLLPIIPIIKCISKPFKVRNRNPPLIEELLNLSQNFW